MSQRVEKKPTEDRLGESELKLVTLALINSVILGKLITFSEPTSSPIQ